MSGSKARKEQGRQGQERSEKEAQELARASETLRGKLELRLGRELAKLREALGAELAAPLWQTEDHPEGSPPCGEWSVWPARVRWRPADGRFCLEASWWEGPATATVGEALGWVSERVPQLAAAAARLATRAAPHFASSSRLAAALLARDWLADRWEWPALPGADIYGHGRAPMGPEWCAFTLLRVLARGRQAEALQSIEFPNTVLAAFIVSGVPRFPREVSGQDVSDACRAAAEVAHKEGTGFSAMASTDNLGQGPSPLEPLTSARPKAPADGSGPRADGLRAGPMASVYLADPVEGSVPGYNIGLLLLADREVEQDRKRPALALDAGRPHAELLAGWRDVPKDPRKKHLFAQPVPGRVELLGPGLCVQLALDLGETTPEAVTVNLRKWRGPMGLRHWAALQRLWSVEGSRSGEVLWTLDAHLEALGYATPERTRLELRQRVAEEVRLLTRLELAVYDRDEKLRERRPLVIRVSETDKREADGAWLTSAMRLQINPLLYEGVRTREGALGTNWFPAPAELARVDHRRHPYVTALGLLLPVRWRREWANNGRDCVALKGRNLLDLAGIPHHPRKPGLAWKSLADTLEKLRDVRSVGHWEWEGGEPALGAVCRIYPADWAGDRTLRGVKPVELPPGPQALTGDELRELRRERGLKQAELAQRLGMAQATISRLERRGAELLPADVVAQVRALGP